jgi:hypothetical protein
VIDGRGYRIVAFITVYCRIGSGLCLSGGDFFMMAPQIPPRSAARPHCITDSSDSTPLDVSDWLQGPCRSILSAGRCQSYLYPGIS